MGFRGPQGENLDCSAFSDFFCFEMTKKKKEMNK